MHIKRLRIDGLRGFTGPRAVDLDFTRPDGTHAGWTVLAGRNGSGKTSLLQTLVVGLGVLPEGQEWAAPAGARVEVVVELSGEEVTGGQPAPGEAGFAPVTEAGAEAEGAGTAAGDDEGFAEEYVEGYAEASGIDELAADELLAPGGPFAAEAALELRVRTWWAQPRGRSGAAKRPRLRRDYRLATADRTLAAELPAEVGADLVAYAVLEPLIAAGAHRRLGGAPGAGRDSALGGLFDEEETLAEGVARLVDLHHRGLGGDAAAAALLRALLDLLDDGLMPDGHRPVRVDADGLWVRREPPAPSPHRPGQAPPAAPEQALQRLSDGYRSAVALVLHLCRYDGPPDVVLIDEVDAHLHVTWQQRIGPWLKRHFPGTQFIVTTHSPYICQSADPGGLIRLPGPDEAEPPQVVDPDLHQRIVYGSGDDAVLSELFGLESPYSAQAERLRRRIGDLEADVLSGQASDAELEEYRELSERLTSSMEARVDEVAARLARRG